MPTNNTECSSPVTQNHSSTPYIEEAAMLLMAIASNNPLDVYNILSSCKPQDLKPILSFQDTSGASPFILAARLEDIAILKILLETLGDLEDDKLLIQSYQAKDSYGKSYNDYCSNWCNPMDNALRKLLQDIKARYEGALDALYSDALDYNTPQINPAYSNEDLKLIFTEKINQPNDKGNPPLIQMILDCNTPMIEWLLSQPGIDLRAKNNGGMNALMVAAQAGFVEYLLPLLNALRPLRGQEVADIYNDSEMAHSSGMICSVKEFFYLQRRDTKDNYKKIKRLLDVIDGIAQSAFYKSAEENKLTMLLRSTFHQTNRDNAREHRQNLLKKLKELNECFIPCEDSALVNPEFNNAKQVLFSLSVHTQTPETSEEDAYVLSQEPMRTTDGPS